MDCLLTQSVRLYFQLWNDALVCNRYYESLEASRLKVEMTAMIDYYDYYEEYTSIKLWVIYTQYTEAKHYVQTAE